MYLIFGILTVLLNLLVYTIFTKELYVNYMMSNLASWIISIIFAYITNKFFVFKSNALDFIFLCKEILWFISFRFI